MSEQIRDVIGDVAELLAHALVLEQESVERYLELADSMEVHNNPEAADLFRKLSGYGERHAREVAQLAEGMALPDIEPWGFKWTCVDGAPESACMEEAHYRMTGREVLELALHNEVRGRDFYAEVARSSPDPEVRRIADGLAREEDEHVALLEALLSRTPEARAVPTEDMDPPNVTG